MAELRPFPRVKVCGLARPEDAVHALSVGAEALGFVFHPGSPRCISPELAAATVSLLPPEVWTVAVVVDSDPDKARALLANTGIRALQLCGQERPGDWLSFEAPLLRRVGVEEGAPGELAAWSGVAAGYVLDHPESPGGSGRPVDGELAARLCASHPCLLAGGLDGARVAASIRNVRPRGVDASSRLASTAGVKAPTAVQAFVQTALATFHALEQ